MDLRCHLVSHFFSPLRNLPSPPVSPNHEFEIRQISYSPSNYRQWADDRSQGAQFSKGHSTRLFDNPIGGPQRQWLNNIPNPGLIDYRVSWNAFRIMPTTPSALSEILLAKFSTLIKPPQPHDSLSAILRIGLLLVGQHFGKEIQKGNRRISLPWMRCKASGRYWSTAIWW